MNFIKKCFGIASISIILINTNNVCVAANSKKDISISSILTQEEGLWYPGKIESKYFYITNNNENNISIDRLYMELKSVIDLNSNQVLSAKSKQFKELAENSTIKISYDNTVLFEEVLDKLLSKKGITLSEEIHIKPNEKALLSMTIDMDERMGNDSQSLESIFSIGAAYKIEDTKSPINPPIEQPTNPDTSVGGESDKLPQTGGIINSASMIAFGTIAIGAGIVLNKKSSQEKGGKHHE